MMEKNRPPRSGEGATAGSAATPSKVHFVAANDSTENSAKALHIQHLSNRLAGAAVSALRCWSAAQQSKNSEESASLERAARKYDALASDYARVLDVRSRP